MINNNMQKIVCFVRCIHRDDRIHHYCGYVGISNNDASVINNELLKTMNEEDKEQLLYDAIASKLNVHGDVTFSSCLTRRTPIIPISDIPNNWYEYHYYGFDLNHLDDDVNGVSTDFEYAVRETLNMQKQLEQLIAKYVPSTGD